MSYSSQQLTDSFAIGHVYVVPTSGLLPENPTPFEAETISEISLDYKGKSVELRGQYLVPADARMADVSITGKMTVGTWNLNQLNNILFAGTINISDIDGINADEPHTPTGAGSPPTYTVTVTNAESFSVDLGVNYPVGTANSPGQLSQLESVATAEDVVQSGQYYVDTTTGVYTFFDDLPVQISYIAENGVGASLTIPNNLQGQSPVFEFVALNSGSGSGFVGYRFYNCRATGAKILSGKNNDFNKIEIDFTVFAPPGQNVGELIQTVV
jgi:hypothetical protein